MENGLAGYENFQQNPILKDLKITHMENRTPQGRRNNGLMTNRTPQTTWNDLKEDGKVHMSKREAYEEP